MSTIYHAIYKCRLCGSRFESPLCINDETAAWRFVLNTVEKRSEASTVPICDAHTCESGSIGFGDFCGMRREEEE